MTTSSQQHLAEHLAHCIQVFGGITAASRRLGIDERALRRFANLERPLSTRLLEDTAKALRLLAEEAATAAAEAEAMTKAEQP